VASKATYSAIKKANVYVSLTTNNGNFRRTSKDTGVPEATIRRWQKEWEANGPPKQEEVQQAIDNYVETAEEIRNELLLEIRRQNRAGELKGAALVTAYGVLDDKVTRAKGLATGRVEHVHQLPAPEEIRAAMKQLVQGARDAQVERAADIDAEIVEQAETPALPPARQ
jgi:hypothetical protein